MAEIKEVKLPGLGVRYEFTTQEGKRSGVVSHRSGREELYFPDPKNPDAFKRVLGLTDEDARTLAEILGGSRIAEELAGLQQRIEGLAIDWLSPSANIWAPMVTDLFERRDPPLSTRPSCGSRDTTTRMGRAILRCGRATTWRWHYLPEYWS